MSNPQPFRHILVIEDRKAKRVIYLDESTYSIGRDSTNAIVIYDQQVSRYHATLLRTIDYKTNSYSYRVIDGDLQGKRSTNGVIINGKASLSHELKHGDVIRFGGKAQTTYQVVPNNADIDTLQLTASDKTTGSKNLVEEAGKRTLTSDDVDRDFDKLTQEELVRLASFPELSPNPIIEIDWSGNLTYVNPAANVRFKDLSINKPEHPIIAGLLNQSQNRQGSLFLREVKIGKEVFEQYVHYLSESKLIRSYIFDFTKRKQIEAELRESEERYRAILRQISEGIFLVDAETKQIIEANYSYCNLLGYSLEEIQELTIDELVQLASGTIEEELSNIVTDQRDFFGKSLHKNKEGNLINLDISISPISYSYNDKELFCVVVRENSETQEKVLSQGFYDFLTGLPNANLLKTQFATALANAQRYQNHLAIMYLDLDQFQAINEKFSYAIGDEIIQEIAKRLKTCLRAGDVLSRWQNDEFILLLPKINSPKDVAKISKRILNIVRESLPLDDQMLEVTMSIGIGVYPLDGETQESLLKNTQIALERVKKQGGNNYGFYRTVISSQAATVLRLEHLLTNALKKEQFSLHYQPQVNIKTKALTGMEALLRWEHPELGQVSPSQFIRLAEETSLIILLDEWVIKTACSQLKAWQETGLTDISISVNTSAQQFQQSNFPDLVKKVLEETQISPSSLTIEITESCLLNNLDFAKKTCESLQKLGVKLCLDDFGTGTSSFSYLEEFSFDIIKIAQVLFKQLHPDKHKEIAIISAIITLANGYHLRVVAEGVETQEQLELLRSLHCEEIQGYLFSRPLPLEEATNFLRHRNYLVQA